ncbi:hypothetical protein PMIN04_007640 [Paraphaeosphaeria minitans]
MHQSVCATIASRSPREIPHVPVSARFFSAPLKRLKFGGRSAPTHEEDTSHWRRGHGLPTYIPSFLRAVNEARRATNQDTRERGSSRAVKHAESKHRLEVMFRSLTGVALVERSPLPMAWNCRPRSSGVLAQQRGGRE